MKLWRNGSHYLVEVTRSKVDSLSEQVVRWCKVCGAIVVD